MRKISEEKLALERQRLEGMREFENKYSDLGAIFARNYTTIFGKYVPTNRALIITS